MKKLTISMILIICIILLSGCDEVGESIPSDIQIEYSDFDLVIDSNTNIVYIDNAVSNANGIEHHVYTPYYSKNGKICKFVDGKIIDWE